MNTRGSGFQHRSLKSAGAASPGQRPAAAAAGGSASRFPAGMMHGDGHRGDGHEGTGVVLAGLDPVSTGTGKPT